jgi:hypothetical protein
MGHAEMVTQRGILSRENMQNPGGMARRPLTELTTPSASPEPTATTSAPPTILHVPRSLPLTALYG